MKEIKFRGKCIKGRRTGQFVYGDLLHFDSGKTSIRTYDADGVYTLLYAVDPATVGQFTGLRDAKGVEIYEGDILQSENGQGIIRTAVVFKHGTFAFTDEDNFDPLCYLNLKRFKVIGNVHDAPELLK